MSTPEGMTRRTALKRTAALLGGVISAPVWSSVLSGCAGSGDDWSPVLFSPDQLETVATLADIIIPETDTPGARAANVHRTIDTLVGKGFLADDRDRFLSGLVDVDARCRNRYDDTPFLECTPEQQTAVVAELDDTHYGPNAVGTDPEAPPFYRMLKELVLVGYYTSEIGATQELKLNLVPGYYDGDVPYEEIGRAWAQ